MSHFLSHFQNYLAISETPIPSNNSSPLAAILSPIPHYPRPHSRNPIKLENSQEEEVKDTSTALQSLIDSTLHFDHNSNFHKCTDLPTQPPFKGTRKSRVFSKLGEEEPEPDE